MNDEGEDAPSFVVVSLDGAIISCKGVCAEPLATDGCKGL